ncbi:CHRD domain-containing protein [Solitalea sp. MAHUQ-68]|uniref:CHRD domain-containing protein n=1 Tax=Solitalea agri TaxID=2953739 RepID=A0A9X2JFZ8_9SPHI|nr:CHRD domain-containing protein [Solitalea agri]MCO4293921.1 CHRD domain-containing protein [Solitalea agri]
MRKSDLTLVKGMGCFLLLGFFITSCNEETASLDEAKPLLAKEFEDAPISARFEVPAHMNRNETGKACFHLYNNRKLYFEISVSHLDPTDHLTVAHIHEGGTLETGPILVMLVDNNEMKFDSNNSIKDTVDVTEEQYQRILAGNDLYINIHSMQKPAGLLRNQLDHPLKFGADIDLLPGNQVPAVSSTATGNAQIRISEDKMLFTKVTVANLESGDNLLIAHIHKGTATENGPVIINVADNASQIGSIQSRTINDTQFADLFANPLYVNVHSTNFPGGIIRGQLKD